MSTNREHAWQIAVFEGLHAGALVDLPDNDWMLIGCAEDCDVVLRDAGMRAHHFALFVRDGAVQVRAIDGELRSGGQVYAPGQTLVAGEGSVWHCGEAVLGLGHRDSAAWEMLRAQHPRGSAAAAESAGADGHAATDADGMRAGDDANSPPHAGLGADAPPILPTPRPFTHKAWQLAIAAIAVVAVVGAGAMAWSLVSQSVHAREARTALAQVMSSLDERAEVRVVEAAGGPPRLEGTVRTESDRARLLDALKARGLYPSVDVVTGEQLAAMVQNGFRQRGLDVRVQYVGAGRVEVQGAPPSPSSEQVVRELLARKHAITQIALTDAPAAAPEAVADVSGSAGKADAPTQSGSSAASARDPKRVVGVVGGETPFILTQDGRRYLVGSMLPDGTQLDHIELPMVTFSRQGKPMPVRF
jgi:type III secretion system YscD/HrpQ family protein